jgi:hypothetical protein
MRPNRVPKVYLEGEEVTLTLYDLQPTGGPTSRFRV